MIASAGCISRTRRTSVSTSTSPPAVGISSATTRFANKKAMPPAIPGSTPRIGGEPLSASGWNWKTGFMASPMHPLAGGDRDLHPPLHFLEGAPPDLAHPFARDADLPRQPPERHPG